MEVPSWQLPGGTEENHETSQLKKRADIPTEIWNKHTNTNVECYRYADPLGNKFMSTVADNLLRNYERSLQTWDWQSSHRLWYG
jgi:hypothetical protein